MYKNSSFFVAAVISIAVHATAVVYLGHYDALHTDQEESQSAVMHISLAPARPAAPKPEPPPIPEAAPEPEPPPPQKPAPRPVVKQEPLPEPVRKPRPAREEMPEPAERIEELIVASTFIDAPTEEPVLAQVVLENERESYLQRLLAHIDSHKFYPRSARRRGMEGEVQVAFYLLRDGGISNLQVKGGSKVLRKAAEQAVQQALSLPPPPESVHLQEQIRFGMVYRLDGQT